jgi:hypothetical protein
LKIEEFDDLILIWGPLSREGISYLQEQEWNGALRVLVPEHRPFLIGLAHNIPLLKKHGIPSVYCTDNMLGFLFYKRKISTLLLFCKDVGEEEMTGYCGSLFAVLLAKLHGTGIRVFHQDEGLVCRTEDERIETDLVALELAASRKQAVS